MQRIERVQNQALWTKYVLRRAEIMEAMSVDETGVNEQMLFHGTHSTGLASITQEGFDIRVANMSGALGAGMCAGSVWRVVGVG